MKNQQYRRIIHKTKVYIPEVSSYQRFKDDLNKYRSFRASRDVQINPEIVRENFVQKLRRTSASSLLS